MTIVLKKKQSKSEEDLKDDFLKLLEGASKEALKSEEDLFYYLLLKDFYYFDMLSKYIEEGKDCDFMKICNEIYKKKFPESVENQEFFCENLFSSLLTKFTNFHNNNYLKRLKILEEIEEKYFASKNNESVDNKTIKDNFNNNKFTMKFNADSVVKPNTCDNHYRKRKSIDCNDKSSFKKQRLEGVIKRIHENKSHPLGNSETNFDNQEIVDETKLDNYSKFTLEKFRSKNINDNRLNQDESFNLNLLNQETPASQNLQFSNLENEISNDNKVQYRGF